MVKRFNNFLMDVDGVCADFVTPVFKYLGREVPEIKDWNFFNSNMNLFEKTKAYELLKDPDFWRYQPIIQGAQEGIEKIRSKGFDVIFCTSPWLSCKEWGNSRHAWLKENFGMKDNEIMKGDCKYICSSVCFLDDKLTAVKKYLDYHNSPAFVFDYSHNRDSSVPRMYGWKDLDNIIRCVDTYLASIKDT